MVAAVKVALPTPEPVVAAVKVALPETVKVEPVTAAEKVVPDALKVVPDAQKLGPETATVVEESKTPKVSTNPQAIVPSVPSSVVVNKPIKKTKAEVKAEVEAKKKKDESEAQQKKEVERAELLNIVGKTPGISQEQKEAKAIAIKAQYNNLVSRGLPITLKDLAEAHTQTPKSSKERIKNIIEEAKTKQHLNNNGKPIPITFQTRQEKESQLAEIIDSQKDMSFHEKMGLKITIAKQYQELQSQGYPIDIKEFTKAHTEMSKKQQLENFIIKAKKNKREANNLVPKTQKQAKQIEEITSIFKKVNPAVNQVKLDAFIKNVYASKSELFIETGIKLNPVTLAKAIAKQSEFKMLKHLASRSIVARLKGTLRKQAIKIENIN